MGNVTERDLNANRATDRSAAPAFDRRDYWAMLIAAVQVLWAPVAMFVGGFFLFYVLSWLWLRVF
jgi:hypothetical protein